MKPQIYVAFVGGLALLLFLRHGLSPGTMVAVLVWAILAAIPWYFGTRNRSTEPSRLERILASLWVWFRRIIGVGAGALFLWAGWDIAWSTDSRLMGGVLALLGFGCIYFGIVGQGWNSTDWRDDVDLHQDNKRRYKWWF